MLRPIPAPLPAPVHAGADPSRWQRLARVATSLWFLEDELAVLPRFVPSGATCVDVGANRGAYTVALSLLAGPRGRVLAVEPQPGPLRTTMTLRQLLRRRNVEIHQLALGDEEAQLSLVVPYRLGMPVYGRSFLGDAPRLEATDLAGFGSARDRQVTVTTLDALTAARDVGRLDFVKCDIEGAELRMLEGAQATIERHRPVLLIEIEDRHTRKYGYEGADVLRWLAARGYRAHALAGDALVPVDAVHADTRNYLFLPE